MEIIKHKYSEQEAYIKLSALCASAEYCEVDMRKKMNRWNIIPNATENKEDDAALLLLDEQEVNRILQDRIIEKLRTEKFIDDERYACAFVRDKFRYNHWGRVRIRQELKIRKIDSNVIDAALEEIPEDDNLDVLRRLIETKRKSVKGKSEYEIRGKLIRFAMGRGFAMDDIMKVVGDEDFD